MLRLGKSRSLHLNIHVILLETHMACEMLSDIMNTTTVKKRNLVQSKTSSLALEKLLTLHFVLLLFHSILTTATSQGMSLMKSKGLMCTLVKSL